MTLELNHGEHEAGFAGDDSLMTYYNNWCQLRSQLCQYKVKLKLSQDGQTSNIGQTGLDNEETDALRASYLHESSHGVDLYAEPTIFAALQIGILNEELLELSTRNTIKSSLLQCLQLGQATLEVLHEPSSTEDSLRIKSLVDTTTKLASKALRIHQEMDELQVSLMTAKTENAELMRACLELTCTHQKLISDKQAASKSGKDQRLTRAFHTQGHLIDKLEVLQNCFRGLILGSGINWSDDEELRTMVFDLGQSVDDLLN